MNAYSNIADLHQRRMVSQYSCSVLVITCTVGEYSIPPEENGPTVYATVYNHPGLLPTGTHLKMPTPGRICRAKFPSGGGLMDDSGTSRT